MLRMFTVVSLMVLVLLGMPAGILAQTASPVADEKSLTITEQRINAVPFGVTGEVEDVALKVLSYTTGALHLLAPDVASFIRPETEQVVAVEFEVTNNGDEPVAPASLAIRSMGNGGTLEYSSVTCEVEHSLSSRESAPVEPGQTITSMLCLRVHPTNVDSLQLWVAKAQVFALDWNDVWAAGIWFDLGAPGPVAPGLTADERAALAAGAEPADPRLANAATSSVAQVGDLVYQLDSWELDGRATLSTIDPGGVWTFVNEPFPLATFTVTNVGDTPAAVDAYLVGPNGVGLPKEIVPAIFNPAGMLMPGFAVERTFVWSAPGATPGTQALALISGVPGTPNGWMMPDGAEPFAFSPTIPPAAAQGADAVVPLGSDVLLNQINVQLVPSNTIANGYTATFTALGEPGIGRNMEFTIRMGDDVCRFIWSWGNSLASTGVYITFLVTGASMVLDLDCSGVTTPGEELTASVRAIRPAAEAQQATFTSTNVVAPDAPGPVVTQDTGDGDDSATTSDPVPAPTATGGTATVIAATANVRGEATTAGAIVDVVMAGQVVTITGDPVDAGGYTWLPVTTPDGVAGWIASQLVEIDN